MLLVNFELVKSVVSRKHHLLWFDTTCVQMRNQYAPNIYIKIIDTRILRGSVIKLTFSEVKNNNCFTNN